MAKHSANTGKAIIDQQAQAHFPCRTRTIVRAVALAMFAGGALPVMAMPTGGVVAAGSATIGAVTNNRMQIDQSSQKAVLNWQGFSIAGNESVHFQQPAGGVALNRVLGTDPSSIFGALSATGKLFLVNPNGVFFAPGASVDVGGLVASTLNMSNEDFMGGNFRFINGGAAKNILNQGTLRAADGGYIALLAPEVRNEGVVSARMGTVAFGSGDKVRLDMNGDGLLGMVVEKSAVQGLIENRHMAEVSGGQVIMSARAAGEVANSVINNTGVIKATGLVVRDGVIRLEAAQVNQHGLADAGSKGSVSVAADAIMSSGTTRAAGGDIAMQAGSIYLDGAIDASGSGAGGSISLSGHAVDIASSGAVSADGASGGSISLASDAGGRVLVSGSLSAQGSAGAGGDIKATAWNLSLLGGSADADGTTQGGKIWWGGAGPDQRGAMAQAEHTLVSSGASMSATGAQGGEIINYGKSSLDFLGSAQAQGANGNGGFIEVSSQGDWTLAQQAQIDAGAGGTLLIDPKNINIDASTVDPQNYVRLALKMDGSPASVSPANTAADGDHFGYAVALSADRMAVGQTEFLGTQQGSVFLFHGLGSSGAIGTPQLGRKLGSGSAILDANGNATTLTLGNGDVFGTGLAMQGERLAVGAQWSGSRDKGAVYLFDGLGTSGAYTTTPRLAMTLADGSALTGAGSVAANLALADGDNFGNALAMDGNRLVVGAYLDDTDGTDRGAVYIFDNFGANGVFDTASMRLAKKLGSSSGVGPGQSLFLADNDNFGYAVAISGDRMAVGAWNDANRGAVYLFDSLGGTTLPFDQTRLVTKLTEGSGLGVGGTTSVLSINSGDKFGSALAMDGDRLAVGAYGDDTGGNERGAVYLFDGVGGTAPMSARPRMVAKIAHGTTLAAGSTTATLEIADNAIFGSAIALAADRLAVGAYNDSSSGTERGSLYLFETNNVWANGWASTYSSNASANQTIAPTLITGLLATGQNVVLQANNDITLVAGNNLSVVPASGNGGALTLQAGRSILLNGNITSANGDVSILGNQPASTGVVSADRDAGNAVINMAAGTTIDAGTGNVVIRLADGAGNTNTASGDITLANITAGTIEVVNQGPTAGSDVVLRNGATLTASGSGTSITLAAAGTGGGTFTNQGSENINPGPGRFLIYSNNPGATAENISGAAKRYATSFGSTTGVAATGNYFLYSVAPTLNVAANGVSTVYGDAQSALTYSATGFIDGDTANTALTGALARGAGNNAGTYAITQDTLADLLGYTINYTGANYVITPRGLTVTSATADSKVYDGTTAATLTGVNVTGFVNGETLAVSSASGAFSDKNVGNNKQVTINGLSLADGSNGGLASNYTLGSVASGVTTNANITPRTVTGSITAADKVYDGNTSTTVNGSLANMVAGDALNLGIGASSFSDKNAGTGKTVTATGLSISGGDAGNYVLASGSATTTASITARGLNVTSFTADNKVYDGTVVASVHGTLDGSNIVAGDSVALGTTGSFSDKNAGTGKTVTATAMSLTGADAANYTIAPGAMTATADITARNITASVTGSNKVYDGTTAATVNGQLDSAVLVSGDILAVTAASASFSDKNVGNGKTVTATGLQLSGADAGNYVLANAGGNATVTADITPRAVTVSIGADSKVYDGTAAATLNSQALSNGVAGDDLSFSLGAASFSDKNAGTGKAVTAGVGLSGADAGNYVVAPTATTTADISPRAVTASVTGNNKVYDATTTATVNGSVAGTIAGDSLGVSAASANFDNANAGTGKPVTASGLALNGADAGNYVLASNTANTTADITLRSLTVQANDVARFEGRSNPAFTASYTGLVGSDSPAVVNGLVLMSAADTTTPTGSYAITASGATAQNYQVRMVNGVLSIIPVPPQPVFNAQVDAAVASAQSLLTVNSALESAIQVAQASDEEGVSPTTGARSGQGSRLLEIRGTGIRMPEGVAAQ